jgi:hypothetical protein
VEALAAAAVFAILLSCVRVASDPASAEPIPDFSVDTTMDEVRTEVRATVLDLGPERAYWEGHFNRLAAGMRLLEERLSVSGITQGSN